MNAFVSATPAGASQLSVWRRYRFALISLVCASALTGAAFLVQRSAQPPLPVLADVPAFELTDETAAPFGSPQLLGRVWIGNFIFTRCPTICPTFSKHMATIQRSTPSDVSLVSISVDPKFDTPEKLKAYGEQFGAVAGRWHFLTAAEIGPINTLSQALFQPLERPDNGDLASLVHGSYFILVDAKARVRGFYKFNDAEALKRVIRDADQLLRESPPGQSSQVKPISSFASLMP
jgi:protein SCO1